MQIVEDEHQLEVIYNVGINTLLNNSLSIAPNPFSDQMTIVAQKPISNIKIMSVEGVVILQKNFNEASTTVYTEDLNPGLYILFVTFADHSSVVTKALKH